MEHKPKVTIGLCVKNVERTIKEAIDSVLDQDFPHEFMELIVVDGYSKDKTLAVIRESISGNDIEYKVFYENKGLGFARQIVVDNARGDYIVWVDGDMVLAKDHVRKQVEFMDQNPKIGIAGGKFETLPKVNVIGAIENIEWLVWDYEGKNRTTSKPLRNFCGGSIYRVKAIKEVGGFDCRIKGSGEDLDAEYRISEAGWLLHFITKASFHDRRKETLRGLWKENFWYGYGGHYIMHKYRERVLASALLAGLRRSFVGYKLTRRKVVFLLPLQYVFKKMAWCFGFIKAHIEGYGHNFRSSSA